MTVWRVGFGRRLLGAAAGLMMAVIGAQSAAMTIVYPAKESSSDRRPRYPVQVLELALERSLQRFDLTPSGVSMQQERSLRALEGGLIDVAWSVATAERTRRLRCIPIPIDRGLIGWRVLLVRGGDAARFAEVKSLADLSLFRAGMGHDWPDLAVLKAAGIPVVTATSYESLFQMLSRGRFDAFPRALSEVEGELLAHQDLGLEIEPRLLLHYPAGLYFFVNRDNHQLATDIEQGLRLAINDGSLNAAFAAEFETGLSKLALPSRRVLTIEHDALATEMPADLPEQWWFNPAR